jgi:hypothetical protein
MGKIYEPSWRIATGNSDSLRNDSGAVQVGFKTSLLQTGNCTSLRRLFAILKVNE